MVDPVSRMAGLLHAVLPESLTDQNIGLSSASGKYVDRGIESLLAAMTKESTNKNRPIFHMVGGANMLVPNGATTTFDIGTRNIEKARMTFQRLNMKIASQDVGGHKRRIIRVYVADSRVTVRITGEKEHEL